MVRRGKVVRGLGEAARTRPMLAVRVEAIVRTPRRTGAFTARMTENGVLATPARQ